MAQNSRVQELERAAAHTRRKRRRRTLIRDAALALAVALILFGAWKVVALAFGS